MNESLVNGGLQVYLVRREDKAALFRALSFDLIEDKPILRAYLEREWPVILEQLLQLLDEAEVSA